MQLYDVHVWLWEELLSSGASIIGANVFYLLAVWALYTYMKSRPSPFSCKWPMFLYNLGMVGIAGYVSIGVIHVLLSGNLLFICNEPKAYISKSTSLDQHLGHLFTVFYLQKFVEFLDTWFFILRKSFRQLTFLHIYHHCSANVMVWLGIVGGYGDVYLPVLLNSIVHVLMYGHYGASGVGISTPWKPFLTRIQIFQFMFIVCFGVRTFTSCGGESNAPAWARALVMGYMGSMILLFANFFIRAYRTRVCKDQTKTNGAKTNGTETNGTKTNGENGGSKHTTDPTGLYQRRPLTQRRCINAEH
jgi:elongation of very long chain fatty acids protein 4